MRKKRPTKLELQLKGQLDNAVESYKRVVEGNQRLTLQVRELEVKLNRQIQKDKQDANQKMLYAMAQALEACSKAMLSSNGHL